MSWIKSLFQPKYLEWDEYKQKIGRIEQKTWEEEVRKESKENLKFTS